MKRWLTAGSDAAAAGKLARETCVPEPVGAVLVSRGIVDARSADRFMNPRLSEMADPMTLPGALEAAGMIWPVIDRSGRIVVFGDYDADGVISSYVLSDVLRRLGADVSVVLPSRLDEGYGLSPSSLQKCLSGTAPPALLVTVDCGSNDPAQVDEAMSAGVGVIVVDHHHVQDFHSRPSAHVNPKLIDSGAFQELAGAGVVFKLCHALVKEGRAAGKTRAHLDLREYLELIAIATVADVVPLTGENRIIVRHGLDRIRNPVNQGIKALKEVAGLRPKEEVDTYHLGFVLGPRINAAGRMGDAGAALRLLQAEDAGEAEKAARLLDDANRDRIALERRIHDEAVAEAKIFYDEKSDYGVVVGHDGWHKGVMGLVAAKLTALYRRPAVVVAFDGDTGSGSCRSIAEFDLMEGLDRCAGLLDRYGGHRLAAGLTVKKANFDRFRAEFKKACRLKLEGSDLRPTLRIDSWIALGAADETMLSALDRLKPFGEGNPEPVWAVRGVVISGKPVIVKNEHLKMTIASGASNIEGIGFNMAKHYIPDGPIDVAFTLKRNTFRERSSIQIHIRDFRSSSES